MWSLGIIRSDNGYILKWYEENEDGGQVPHTMVVEETDDELEAAQKMLREVLEYFGIFYSKHNKRNLVVKIEGNDEDQ